MATRRAADDAADPTPAQVAYADIPDDERDDWVSLVAQPGIWIIDLPRSCRVCGGEISSGQLARVDTVSAAHARPVDCLATP